jgi:hypothetical protein
MLGTMSSILDKTRLILSRAYKKRTITTNRRINSTTLGLITYKTSPRYYIKIAFIFIILT